MWDGTLFLGDFMVVYLGPAGPAAPHAHPAVQLAVAWDAPLTVELPDRTLRGPRVIVPSGVRHTLDSRARQLAVVFVDHVSAAGRALDQRARDAAAAPPPTPTAPPAPPPRPPADAADVDRFAAEAMGALPVPAPLSPPVAAALAYVDAALDARPTLAGAAAAAHLSPSRLTHVFTPAVGLPFKRYVAWRRLRRVVEEVAEGATLTWAAAAAGFSDSAHLSRTFQRSFGLPPSALRRMRLLRSSP
ncbi:MAG TPA: helix-turn-helix domain-containing protein [Baekduia sp.]|uniref:AraC family transcriptional regulator n=1 Tax=Baekduia sp. TaxID=2600305 RepID=UPI002D797C31|nr:helix-turn-helix domain-containing protein [Baekduia sp.]HET6510309.1 helix-turn-helix domain-containing protein [Baekduia sp.]